MRLSLLLLATNLGAASAFTVPTKSTFVVRLSASETKSSDFATSDFAAESTSIDSSSEYGRIGFTEEKVAMGIDAVEVLQWLGTRDDLIARFIKDNKGMEQEQAESEVDKFMMDAEMVNRFISYEKKKNDPDFIRNSLEENLSDPNTIGIYAAWVIGGVGLAVFKNLIAEPRYQSGEWSEIHINLDSIFKVGGDKAAGEAASVVGDAVVSSVDSFSDAANVVGDVFSQLSS